MQGHPEDSRSLASSPLQSLLEVHVCWCSGAQEHPTLFCLPRPLSDTGEVAGGGSVQGEGLADVQRLCPALLRLPRLGARARGLAAGLYGVPPRDPSPAEESGLHWGGQALAGTPQTLQCEVGVSGYRKCRSVDAFGPLRLCRASSSYRWGDAVGILCPCDEQGDLPQRPLPQPGLSREERPWP